MRMRIASLLILAGLAHAGYAAGFRIVGNPRVPISSLSKSAVSDIFMKRISKWDDGTPIVVVDQTPDSPARISFTTAVYNKNVTAIVSYWQQQIFAGRNVPPVEQSTEQEVLNTLRNTPGAIGYVSDKLTIQGLKVIEIR
jgi:ABC-type phosphate transport system substrate-binding protein